MNRTAIVACLLPVCGLCVQRTEAQNFNFSIGSDGVSVNVNNYDPYMYMAPPPPHHYGAPRWMYGVPYRDGVSSHDYKKYKKAVKKYRKAQEKYMKKMWKKAQKRRHHKHHHDDDDD